MKEELIKRYKEICNDFKEVSVDKSSLRINTLLIDKKKLVKRLTEKGVKLEKIEFLENGYYYSSDFKLSSTQEYLQGMIYIQDVASQLPAIALDIKPGNKVLDMCAAPGSKTTQIGASMKNEGVLVAVDNVLGRIKVLKNNIERCSVKNCVVYKKDARFVNDLGIKFDKILLDAPCSGNYTQEKEWFEKRTIEDFKANARIQKEMIKNAVKTLKKNGELVYSTCSLEPEENEMVIQWALDNLDVELTETNIKIGDQGLVDVFGKELNLSINKCVRIWPHKTGIQGFFIAKLKRK